MILSASCSSDDSEPISKPTFTNGSINYPTLFYHSGQTEIPAVNWNGNQGNFSIGAPMNTLSINTTNGVISWTNLLELVIINVDLVATNSVGSTIKNITIENPFAGEFTGGYSNDPNSMNLTNDINMGFDSNHDMDTKDGGDGGIVSTQGSWTRVGNTVTSTFSYDNGKTFVTTVTEINSNNTQAYLEGLWYNGPDASGTPSGYIRVDLNSTL